MGRGGGGDPGGEDGEEHELQLTVHDGGTQEDAHRDLQTDQGVVGIDGEQRHESHFI